MRGKITNPNGSRWIERGAWGIVIVYFDNR